MPSKLLPTPLLHEFPPVVGGPRAGETGGPQRDDSVQSLTSPRVDLSTRSIGDDLLGGSFLSAWRGMPSFIFDTDRISLWRWCLFQGGMSPEFTARDRHPQLVTRVGRKAPKPQERPTGRRSAPRRENRHRRGWVAFRGTTPPDAQAVPPEALESLGSRKTVAEVPLTGLSFSFENYRSRRRS